MLLFFLSFDKSSKFLNWAHITYPWKKNEKDWLRKNWSVPNRQRFDNHLRKYFTYTTIVIYKKLLTKILHSVYGCKYWVTQWPNTIHHAIWSMPKHWFFVVNLPEVRFSRWLLDEIRGIRSCQLLQLNHFFVVLSRTKKNILLDIFFLSINFFKKIYLQGSYKKCTKVYFNFQLYRSVNFFLHDVGQFILFCTYYIRICM